MKINVSNIFISALCTGFLIYNSIYSMPWFHNKNEVNTQNLKGHDEILNIFHKKERDFDNNQNSFQDQNEITFLPYNKHTGYAESKPSSRANGINDDAKHDTKIDLGYLSEINVIDVDDKHEFNDELEFLHEKKVVNDVFTKDTYPKPEFKNGIIIRNDTKLENNNDLVLDKKQEIFGNNKHKRSVEDDYLSEATRIPNISEHKHPTLHLNDKNVLEKDSNNDHGMDTQFMHDNQKKLIREKRAMLNNIPNQHTKRKLLLFIPESDIPPETKIVQYDNDNTNTRFEQNISTTAKTMMSILNHTYLKDMSRKTNKNPKIIKHSAKMPSDLLKTINNGFLLGNKPNTNNLVAFLPAKKRGLSLFEDATHKHISNIKFIPRSYVNHEGKLVVYLEYKFGGTNNTNTHNEKKIKEEDLLSLETFKESLDDKNLIVNIKDKIYIYDYKILVVPQTGKFSIIFSDYRKEDKFEEWYNDAMKELLDSYNDSIDPFIYECCVNNTNLNTILTFFPWLINIKDRNSAFYKCLYKGIEYKNLNQYMKREEHRKEKQNNNIEHSNTNLVSTTPKKKNTKLKKHKKVKESKQ